MSFNPSIALAPLSHSFSWTSFPSLYVKAETNCINYYFLVYGQCSQCSPNETACTFLTRRWPFVVLSLGEQSRRQNTLPNKWLVGWLVFFSSTAIEKKWERKKKEKNSTFFPLPFYFLFQRDEKWARWRLFCLSLLPCRFPFFSFPLFLSFTLSLSLSNFESSSPISFSFLFFFLFLSFLRWCIFQKWCSDQNDNVRREKEKEEEEVKEGGGGGEK